MCIYIIFEASNTSNTRWPHLVVNVTMMASQQYLSTGNSTHPIISAMLS